MATQKDKLQKFSETLDILKSTLYSLGINRIDNLSIKPPPTEQDDFNNKETNSKKEV